MGLVVLLLALWLVLGVCLLHRAELPKALFWLCSAALLCALVLRVFALDHETGDYLNDFTNWFRLFRENGGFAAIHMPIGNYNAIYLYFMAAISYLPGRDLYLIKLLPIFCDLLLAFTGLRLSRILRPGKDKLAAGAFCLLLLLPTVVLNGAYWAQCDCAYGALAMLALTDTLDKHPARGVVWLALAFSIKLQAIFLVPLWCVLWYSGRVKFKHLWLFPLTYAATLLPALLLGKPLADTLGVYSGQMGLFNDRLTLNAPSVYALIPYGVEPDLVLWPKLGIAAAFVLVAGLLGGLFFFRKRLTDRIILTAAVILTIGVPLFLPYMHERYFFLAETLSVVWALGTWRRAPVAVLVQIAALGGYHAYLVLRYAFPMAWGAWMLIAALIWTTAELVWELRAPVEVPAKKPVKKAAKKPRKT